MQPCAASYIARCCNTHECCSRYQVLVQVVEELNKQLQHAGVDPSSLFASQAPKLLGRPAAAVTAGDAVPQLRPPAALQQAGAAGSGFNLPPSGIASSFSLPLPRKATKKRKSRPESSNASLEAAINSLRSDPSAGPSGVPHIPLALPSSFPSMTANISAAAFGSSATRVAQGPGVTLDWTEGLAGGLPRPSPAFVPHLVASPPGAAASGSGSAALELSLLLTTLQSLANLPEEAGQGRNAIAASSQAAQGQLREWLAQLQQHAINMSSDTVSPRQTTLFSVCLCVCLSVCLYVSVCHQYKGQICHAGHATAFDIMCLNFSQHRYECHSQHLVNRRLFRRCI